MKAAIFLSVFAAVVLADEKKEQPKDVKAPETWSNLPATTTTTYSKKDETWSNLPTTTPSKKDESWSNIYTTTTSKKAEETWGTWSTTSKKSEETWGTWSTSTTKKSSETWATWTEKTPEASSTWATWSASSATPVKSSKTAPPVSTYTGAANKASMVGGAAVGIAAVAFML